MNRESNRDVPRGEIGVRYRNRGPHNVGVIVLTTKSKEAMREEGITVEQAQEMLATATGVLRAELLEAINCAQREYGAEEVAV